MARRYSVMRAVSTCMALYRERLGARRCILATKVRRLGKVGTGRECLPLAVGPNPKVRGGGYHRSQFHLGMILAVPAHVGVVVCPVAFGDDEFPSSRGRVLGLCLASAFPASRPLADMAPSACRRLTTCVGLGCLGLQTRTRGWLAARAYSTLKGPRCIGVNLRPKFIRWFHTVSVYE